MFVNHKQKYLFDIEKQLITSRYYSVVADGVIYRVSYRFAVSQFYSICYTARRQYISAAVYHEIQLDR